MARVAQYLAVLYDPLFPKEQLRTLYENADPPQFDNPTSPYNILANLHLPIYITSNYDNFMEDALKYHHKDPRRELCRWNQILQRTQPSILETGFKPTSADPLIYHLNGHYQTPESLVLTEDDYLDFLVNISSAEYELPPRIQQSFTGSSLLFIGFNPFAWNFRVLFRGLVAATEASLRRISVTVQMPPLPDDVTDATREKVQIYLNQYFDATDRRMRVYWGTSNEFLTELNQRWQGLTTEKATAAEAQPQINIFQLQQNLADTFSLDELREMVQFHLKIDHDTFSDTKPSFIMEMIVYLQHRKRLHELVETCQKLRPSTQWN